MFSKTNLISTIVGTIWAYLGGWLIWGIIGASIFQDPGNQNGDQVHIVIACLISAFTISTIYSKWAGGNHSLSNGANYGLWVGLLIGFGERWFDLAFDTTPNLQDAVVNGILNVVFYIILGVLISAVYGKVK